MEPATLLLPLASALAFLAGVLVAAAGTRWLLALRRQGRLCPSCGSTTLPLQPRFPASLMGNRVLRRWCPGCGWEGLSIRPPHEGRGADGRVHLRGGFRWGSPPRPPSELFYWSRDDGEGEDRPKVKPRRGFFGLGFRRRSRRS